jgi:hypothetical protein
VELWASLRTENVLFQLATLLGKRQAHTIVPLSTYGILQRRPTLNFAGLDVRVFIEENAHDLGLLNKIPAQSLISAAISCNVISLWPFLASDICAVLEQPARNFKR